MPVDNPRWNDLNPKGLSVNFEDISNIYKTAMARAIRHGEMPPREAFIDNTQLASSRDTMSKSIVEKEFMVNDLVITTVEIEIDSDYSAKTGEWIGIDVFINLTNEYLEFGFLENIDLLKKRLEKITETKWRKDEEEVLWEIVKLPLTVGLIERDPEDPEDYPSIIVSIEQNNMTEKQFIQLSEKLSRVISLVTSSLYLDNGYKPVDLNLTVGLDSE